MNYTDPFEDAITVQDAALMLGVSRPTVYRLIAEERLAARPNAVTGRKQVSRQAVLRLISGSEYSAGAEPAPRIAEVASGVADYRLHPAMAPSVGFGVDSIFRLPELALELPADDVSERVDYYRFHGLAEA